MTDQEQPGAEQPELLTIAEILYQHASQTIEDSYDLWLENMAGLALGRAQPQVRLKEGYRAGWRAALGWYAALVTRPPLADQAAAQLRASIAEVPTVVVNGRPQLAGEVDHLGRGMLCPHYDNPPGDCPVHGSAAAPHA